MKLQVKLISSLLLLMAVVLTNCTGKPAKKVPESPYSLGVIDSSNDSTTYLYLLDGNLQKTDTLRCPYRGVGSFGAAPVQILDGVLYEQWTGSTMYPHKCAVVAMDLQTGEWKDYTFEGEGVIEDFRVNENGIFVLSSAKDTSVDYYSFNDGSHVAVTVKDASGGLAISVHGYDVYFIAEEITDTGGYDEMEESKTFLYHVNIKEQSQEKLLDVTEELGESVLNYTQWYEGKMYIPDCADLCVYDPEKNEIHQIPLPGKEAYQIQVDEERLYIVDCDVRNDGETDIYRFNPETKEVEATYHFAEETMQSYMKDGIFYALQQEPITAVRKYELLPDGTCRKLAEAVIEAETDSGHRISDMFVK